MAANQTAAQQPADPRNMQALISAESGLAGALGKLMMVAESYPDLKANQTMARLMEELTSTENKISFARQAYNDSVMRFNIACQTFPSNMIAGTFNFQQAALWEITEAKEREAVKVQF
jgi:LemA protein